MFRRTLARVTCGALLAAPLVALPTLTASADPVVGQPTTWGRTVMKNQRIKRGCKSYPYRYVVDPPTDDWSAELFLKGPRGRGLASAALIVDSDRPRARRAFRLCEPSLRPGRYKLRMKVTYLDGYDKSEGFVRNTVLRFHRR